MLGPKVGCYVSTICLAIFHILHHFMRILPVHKNIIPISCGVLFEISSNSGHMYVAANFSGHVPLFHIGLIYGMHPLVSSKMAGWKIPDLNGGL